MKNNAELQKDVQDAIRWDPSLNGAEIGVTAKDGVVTLSGTVDRYSKKSKAEDTAKNVAGVQVVVEKIEINFKEWATTNDSDIAKEIINAFKWNFEVPNDKVKVSVEDGWVTLDGELFWNFQREAACDAVSYLNGVKGVSNNIKIKSDTHDTIEQEDIEDAIERNWALRDDDIEVAVNGKKVTLSGTVNSYYQKEEAAKIAWNAPGVEMVVNDLVVEYDYAMAD